MEKLITQALITIGLFFGIWFGLQQINWLSLFNVEQTQISTEEALGDLYWEWFSMEEEEITIEHVVQSVDSILSIICENNDIDKEKIKLHIINNSEVNAFALPNNHLILNSGLILASENQAELAGVIGHEIAHMELNHVMKKLIKEVGLAVIVSMTTGNNNGQVLKESAKLLSSTAYDRKLEKEADLKAVEYLENAQLDSEPFANFLFRFTLTESLHSKHLVWISTHPNSEDRAKYILKNRSALYEGNTSVLREDTWKELKLKLTE